MKTYKVIGLMSGTSLDGLDMAYCEFTKDQGSWHFEIKAADTQAYDQVWVTQLNQITKLSGESLMITDMKLGRWMGDTVKAFMEKHQLDPDFIASHGHTVFHQPDIGLTCQIGNGFALQATCQKPVIANFRNFDLAIGGQGAPLVPIGDQLLFSQYDFCLNLGGISNVSTQLGNQRIAFDIGPANMPLNYFAQKLGHDYDPDGQLAASGTVQTQLLDQMNDRKYYKKRYPKSLGYEWVSKYIIKPLESSGTSMEDCLATCAEHGASQIAQSLLQLLEEKKLSAASTLVTGGGAFNQYFIDLLRKYSQGKINYIIPDSQLVGYKEALVFAFLGVLRYRKEVNCLSSVTGAAYDHSAGVVYGDLT